MFKSISEIRKGQSKDKNNTRISPIQKQIAKTSNNPYLDNDKNF